MATKQQKLEQALSLSQHTEFRSHDILNFVINNFSLGEAEFKVYTYLLGLSNNNKGVCFPSGAFLSKEMEVSRPRIVQITNKLKEKGLLFIEQLEKGGSNFYIIPTIEYMQNVVVATTKAVVEKVAAKIKSTVDQVSEMASKVVETVEKVAKTIKKFAPKSDTKPTYNKKPVRTEMIPDWFDKPYVAPVLTEEQKLENERKRREIEELLKATN